VPSLTRPSLPDMSAPAPWLPPPARIVELYEQLAEASPPVLELAWRCPGRRAPTPQVEEQEEADQEEAKPETTTNHMDFDDDDDEAVAAFSTPTQRRTPGNLKGSARKKTTSLDNVLSNMRRHRIEDNKD